MAEDDTDIRIADLERELQQRDEKIKEQRAEVMEAQQLVDQMREQVEDADRLIESWIDTFEMQRGETGDWLFDPQQSELWNEHAELLRRWNNLVRQWNKFVPEYNAAIRQRNVGRPVAASEAQHDDVRRRHKAGDSLRAIAKATGLGLTTVRTIIASRPRKAINALRRLELDRLRAARYRARKKTRDELPKRIADVQQTGAELVKAAKGLGRR